MEVSLDKETPIYAPTCCKFHYTVRTPEKRYPQFQETPSSVEDHKLQGVAGPSFVGTQTRRRVENVKLRPDGSPANLRPPRPAKAI